MMRNILCFLKGNDVAHKIISIDINNHLNLWELI